jgi:cytidylate kinase
MSSEALTSSAGPGVSAMCAVTISRLYGSGGGEVAARLARRLGWHLLDHEFIAHMMYHLGLSEHEAEERDEHCEGMIAHLLSGLRLGYPGPVREVPPSPVDLDRASRRLLRQVILAATEEGQIVIVGRGGFALLADRRDVLRVLLVAPLKERIAYVMRREGLDERAARERIQHKDQRRRRYIEAEYHLHPGEPEQYDLTVNTAVLTLDHAVALICLALEQKAQRLAAPAEALGPSADMPRYPSQPGDMRLPSGAAQPQEEPGAS